MDQTPQADLVQPPPDPFSAAVLRQRAAVDRAAIWLHGQADRMDLVPSEFGADQPLDFTDGGALRQEWGRLLRRWMDSNPEQMLAIKAGFGALAVALIVLIFLIRSVI